MRRRSLRCAVAAAAVASALLTACSSQSDGSSLQTIEPATAAVSPAITVAPAGSVIPSGTVQSMAFDDSTGTIAALSGDGSTLLLVDGRSPDAPPKSIPLDARGVTVVSGNAGEVLIPADRFVARVDVRTGSIRKVEVDAGARSAVLLPDGRLAIGTDRGTIVVIANDGSRSTISGFASVDGLARTGEQVTAFDKRQTSLTELNIGDSSLGLSLRAGQGAGTATADAAGRILVADTATDSLLVYTADPLVLRQQAPVGPAPYATAYDERAQTVWVTLSGSNEVVGYDLSGGIPTEKKRFPTVRQPNSVVVNSATGELFVGSASGDGLQRIATVEAGAPAGPSEGGR